MHILLYNPNLTFLLSTTCFFKVSCDLLPLTLLFAASDIIFTPCVCCFFGCNQQKLVLFNQRKRVLWRVIGELAGPKAGHGIGRNQVDSGFPTTTLF